MNEALESLVQNNAYIWRGGQRLDGKKDVLKTGNPQLDALLPEGGWPAKSIVEVVSETEGVGELSIWLPVIAEITQRGEKVCFITPPYVPYAPALSSANVALQNLLVAQTPTDKDLWWTAEKMLRSESCGLVIAWPRNCQAQQVRRLQLACDAGNSIGVLFHTNRQMISPSALRLYISGCEQGSRIEILKARGQMKRSSGVIASRVEDASAE